MGVEQEVSRSFPTVELLRAEEDRLRLEPAVGRVLVVEDDPAHRELLVEMLTSWRYEPLAVGSAEEAEYVARRKALDAAIVDVFLPGKSGQTIMSKLREWYPEVVVIGISALGDSAMARQCKGQGADLFLSKPIDPEALAEALQTSHRSWH